MKHKRMNNDDSDLKTIFKYRVPESRARFMRELLILVILFIGFALGFAALAAVQYWGCTAKDPEITLMQCLRGEMNKKGRK